MTAHMSFNGALRLAILGLLAPIGAAFATPGPDTSSVSKVLQEVKVHAGEANYDADLLDSYVRSNTPWQVYSEKLQEIRFHANDLMHDYSRLQKIADSATPQQREAIKRLEPMVRQMADSLTKSIQVLNQDHNAVKFSEFKSQIHTTYANIDSLYQELCKCASKNAA